MHCSFVRLQVRSRAVVSAPLILSVWLSFAGNAVAQGIVTGAVQDSIGTGINGAQISVTGTAIRAESNDNGRFSLRGIPAGPASIHVRRLGFAPTSVDVVVTNGATQHVDFTVTPVAQRLSGVVVQAGQPRHYEGYLAGFYERRDRGFGRFITRDEIAARNPMRMTDMLRMVPGLHISSNDLGESHVRVRGNRCWPSVWIDGSPANAAEFDIDWLQPDNVAGMEIYSGEATVPPEFVDPLGPRLCGTIVVWTQHGEPRKKRTMSAAELAEMVTRLKVYTAEQVDVPAQADSTAPVTPLYPDTLYRQRVPGHVVAEFVVDTAGRSEPETIGIVSSTDARFSASVARAILQARFIPAQLRGRRVRQVVQQPYAFVVPAVRARRP